MISFFKKCCSATNGQPNETETNKTSDDFMSVEAILAAEMSIFNLNSELCDAAKSILNEALVDMRHIYSFRKLEDGGGTIIDEAGRIKCNQITVGTILYALAIHDSVVKDNKGIPSTNSDVLAFVQSHPSDSAQELRAKIGYMALEEKSIRFNGTFSNDQTIEKQIHLDLSNDPNARVKWPLEIQAVRHNMK